MNILRYLMFFSLIMSALCLTSCSKGERTFAGVLIGAGAGAAIGGAAGGGTGAAIGAGVGGVTGGIVGSSTYDEYEDYYD
jgi:uncharacterized protein YcfJ